MSKVLHEITIHIQYIQVIVYFRIFKAGMKLDMFYNLLVKEPEAGQENNTTSIDVQDRKDVIEVSNRFRTSQNFYNSYLTRAILEFLISGVMLAWLGARGFPVIIKVSVLQ